jgi:predicted glycosyl hydrolase (DUF1957 family)
MKSACFFLSLLSIAEEYNKSRVDLLDTARHCMEKKWINAEYFISNDVEILKWLTGKRVNKKIISEKGKCPLMKDNQYSIEKWERNGGYHFKRRYFDVYEGSRTVAEGNFVCYYIYTIG